MVSIVRFSPVLNKAALCGLQGTIMITLFRVYRGLEIYPLVYPRCPTAPGRGHNYESGFDAAVRIVDPGDSGNQASSNTFRIDSRSAFLNAGDARRACIAFAERFIDSGSTVGSRSMTAT